MILVRPFKPLEWQLYRDIRLQALQSDPGVFTATYEKAAAYTDTEWQARINDPDVGVFGVFDDQHVVGMTGVRKDKDEEGRDVAVLWGSWLSPAYRGQGNSIAMYRARFDWALEKELTRVVVSHRESNAASRAANQRHGFVFTHAKDLVWKDGSTEADVFYALELENRDDK